MTDNVPHFPGRAAIDAYGDGGFRFADMSHKGSLLLLPSGVYGWPVTETALSTPEDFAPVFAEAGDVAFLIFGCGDEFVLPPRPVREAFAAANIGLEPMDTGAAARTFNVLLAEGRAVAAALIAVDEP